MFYEQIMDFIIIFSILIYKINQRNDNHFGFSKVAFFMLSLLSTLLGYLFPKITLSKNDTCFYSPNDSAQPVPLGQGVSQKLGI